MSNGPFLPAGLQNQQLPGHQFLAFGPTGTVHFPRQQHQLVIPHAVLPNVQPLIRPNTVQPLVVMPNSVLSNTPVQGTLLSNLPQMPVLTPRPMSVQISGPVPVTSLPVTTCSSNPVIMKTFNVGGVMQVRLNAAHVTLGSRYPTFHS